MAMALRSVAANLKQRIPIAVQQAAPADADLDRFGPEFCRLLERIVEQNRKSSRDDALAAGAGIGLGAVTLVFGIRYLGVA